MGTLTRGGPILPQRPENIPGLEVGVEAGHQGGKSPRSQRYPSGAAQMVWGPLGVPPSLGEKRFTRQQ